MQGLFMLSFPRSLSPDPSEKGSGNLQPGDRLRLRFLIKSGMTITMSYHKTLSGYFFTLAAGF